MILLKSCPIDCYLIEKVPDIETGTHIHKCMIKNRSTKCLEYFPKSAGIRSSEPVVLYYAINASRWKKITLIVSIVAILISIYSVIYKSDNQKKIDLVIKQNSVLLKDNMLIKDLLHKTINGNKVKNINNDERPDATRVEN